MTGAYLHFASGSGIHTFFLVVCRAIGCSCNALRSVTRKAAIACKSAFAAGTCRLAIGDGWTCIAVRTAVCRAIGFACVVVLMITAVACERTFAAGTAVACACNVACDAVCTAVCVVIGFALHHRCCALASAVGSGVDVVTRSASGDYTGLELADTNRTKTAGEQ